MDRDLSVKWLHIILGIIFVWFLLPNTLYAQQKEVTGKTSTRNDIVYIEEQPHKLEDFSGMSRARAREITAYQQTDKRWGAHSYGYADAAGKKKATISTSGCGILAYTNAVYYLNGKFIDPIFLADYAVKNGYRVNGVGTSWALYEGFARSYGSTYKIKFSGNTSSYSTLRKHLSSGGVAVGSVPGHLMAIVDYNSSTGKYLILDSSRSSSRNTYPEGYTWQTESAMKANSKLNFREFRLLSSTLSHSSSQCSHKYTYKTVAPTCTAKGYRKYTCSKCGHTYKANYTNVKGHSYKTSTTKATTKANGKIVKTCSRCKKKTESTIYRIDSITLSTTKYVYYGNVKKPSVKVVDTRGKTISSSNYTVTYPAGRKNIGSYKVTIKFKGNYSGTSTRTFKIRPDELKLKSVSSPTAGQLRVEWSKYSIVSAYQIQYSTRSDFSPYTQMTFTNLSTTRKTITGLQKGKKYYVRARAYKIVGKSVYYSSWSPTKSVTLKK